MKTVEQCFAENLKECRIRRGLTQRDLAARLGYSEKSVSKWETGRAIAPGAVLPPLAEALEVTLDALFDSREEPTYYLGIDGGGTKTAFLLADRRGQVVARLTLGACNPVDLGMEETARVLREGIRRVCGELPLSRVSVYAGIAGGITGDHRQRIRQVLEGFRFARLDNGSDAMNAVAAGLGNGDGVAVILGTGSVAFAREGDTLHRVGGFGYLLDDGGSGFAIGRDGVLAALKAEEGSGEATALLERLRRDCGVSRLLDAVGALYTDGKRGLAALAPAVFETAAQGDGVAAAILRQNLQAVGALITAAAGKLTADRSVRVVLLGGIALQLEGMRGLLEPHVPARCQIEICKESPVIGALRLAGLRQ